MLLLVACGKGSQPPVSMDAPPGKEFGWVPIVLEIEMPYGKWQTDLNPFLETDRGPILDY
jgi:hypothetical protein